MKYLFLNQYLIAFIFNCLLAFSVKSQTQQAKVVLITLDGTPDYLVDLYLKNGVLPNNGAFAKMRKYGAYASRMIPINVASTGPSHISIFTGASPSKTSIIGNSFKKKSDHNNVLTAFRQPINAETIFQAAMRQGKKVIALGGVGLDYLSTERKTNMMHMYPIIVGSSFVTDFIDTDSVISNRVGLRYKVLKPLNIKDGNASIDISGKFKIPLYFYASDTLIDFANLLKRQTSIIIDTDDDINNGNNIRLSLDDWSDLNFYKNNKQYNVSFRIISANKDHSKFKILMTTPVEVFGVPNSFLNQIHSKIGFWPGEPENIKQTHGLIPETIWFEQLDRLARYSKNLILEGMKEKNWDLLFGYFSTLDDVQHRYTLTDPRQIDFKADKGNRPKIYSSYIEQRFRDIDAYLMEIMKAAPDSTNFIIFSDHGMIPIHTTILLNNYFEQLGSFFTKKVLSIATSGNSAHIYINTKLLDNINLDVFTKWLITQLEQLTDPISKKSIFEVVANEAEQKKYGIYHPDYSGHLFVSCKEGYSISAKFQPNVELFVKNTFDSTLISNMNEATKSFLLNGTMNETGRAVHGSLSYIRKGQSIFYSIGPHIPKKKLGTISSLQIAPTVASLLGINPPIDSESKSLF